MREIDSWKLVDLYFRTNMYSLTSHHLDSYNDFLLNKIPNTIKSINPILILKDPLRIEVNIDDVQYKKHTLKDKKGNDRIILPNEARLKNISYAADILVRINVSYFDKTDKKIHEINLLDHKIGTIPIMLHSSLCVLYNQPSNMLQELGECPYDKGGYFIIDGKEKVIVAQERNVTNKLFINRNSDSVDFSYSGFIRSTNFESSVFPKTVSFNVRGNKSFKTQNAIEVSVPHISKPIPLFVLFRALGVESDKEIIEFVCQSMKSDKIVLDFIHSSVVQGNFLYTQNQALSYLSEFTQYKTNENVLHILYENLFTNINPDLYQRALFLGYISNKLVKTCLGMIHELNRDNYIYRRISLSGFLLGDIFKDFYNEFRRDCRSTIDNIFERNYKNKEITVDSIKNYINKKNQSEVFNPQSISKGMMKSMKGQWGTDPDPSKQGIVQDLNRKSYMDFLSHLRRVNTPLSNSSKIIEPHRLSCSQWGIMCPSESPDGASIGLLKNFALLVHISNDKTQEILLKTFKNLNIKPLKECNRLDLQCDTCKILLNYSLYGFYYGKNPLLIYKFYKLLKQLGVIDIYTSITWNVFDNEINILTESGRCCRPLVVNSNKDIQYKNSWKEMFHSNKDLKNVVEKLKEEEIEKFLSEHSNDIGSLEYIDVEEANSSLIAMNNSSANSNHTHVEIHPSTILSVYTATIPFANMNQAPRNIFSGAQGKQAIGVYSTTFNNRIDTMSYLLHYPQKPLVATRYHQFFNADKLPNGENLIVAISTYKGYNQEDSIIINKSSVDRGMFTVSYSKSFINEEEKNMTDESGIVFVNPLKSSVMADKIKIKQFANFNKIDENGFPIIGKYVSEGDVIVGKCNITKHVNNDELEVVEYQDKSVALDKIMSGFVEKVYVQERSDGNKHLKVKLSKVRRPQLGDKLASRHGQKGVIGMIIRQEDMPYTSNGLVPDIIINPHAFPSRMTIGHIIESIVAKLSALKGFIYDGTTFELHDVEKMYDSLGENNVYNRYGDEIMYNGETGEQMETEIFIGPTYYYRLKHMVEDKINYRSKGKIVQVTNQPTHGRGNDGGLRIGEMERDALISHGAASFIKESFMERSDKGRFEINNTTLEIPVAFNTLRHEINGFSIDTKLLTEKEYNDDPIYEDHEVRLYNENITDEFS